MNIYWVADNIIPHNELELFFLFCSVTFWKKNHPTHTLNIVTNSDNVGFYTDMNLWDNVIEYQFSSEYIKGERNLWAIGKLDAMKSFKTPFCILDLDMFYTEVVDFTNMNVMFAHLEDGTDYYLTNNDISLKRSGVTLFSTSNYAANVSFLYIKDECFKNEYVNTALEWAYKFTKSEYSNGAQMILCEQKLLMDVICKYKLKYSTLISDIWISKDNYFINNSNLFNTVFFHLWRDKVGVRNNTLSFLKERSKFFKIIYDRYSGVTKEYTKFRKKAFI